MVIPKGVADFGLVISVGANYRAACRARSKADFVSKISVVEEEADESAYWLELLIETGTTDGNDVMSLLGEANELTAIFYGFGTHSETRAKVNNP